MDFKECIKTYLEKYSKGNNTVFNEMYQMKKDEIEPCCNYIVSEVKKAKKSAFTNKEIFQLAKDYFIKNINASEQKKESVTIVCPTNTEKEECDDPDNNDGYIENKVEQAPKITKKIKKAKESKPVPYEQTSLF